LGTKGRRGTAGEEPEKSLIGGVVLGGVKDDDVAAKFLAAAPMSTNISTYESSTLHLVLHMHV
jgi:hypothetical protein